MHLVEKIAEIAVPENVIKSVKECIEKAMQLDPTMLKISVYPDGPNGNPGKVINATGKGQPNEYSSVCFIPPTIVENSENKERLE